jgi:hypothetical protein
MNCQVQTVIAEHCLFYYRFLPNLWRTHEELHAFNSIKKALIWENDTADLA